MNMEREIRVMKYKMERLEEKVDMDKNQIIADVVSEIVNFRKFGNPEEFKNIKKFVDDVIKNGFDVYDMKYKKVKNSNSLDNDSLTHPFSKFYLKDRTTEVEVSYNSSRDDIYLMSVEMGHLLIVDNDPLGRKLGVGKRNITITKLKNVLKKVKSIGQPEAKIIVDNPNFDLFKMSIPLSGKLMSDEKDLYWIGIKIKGQFLRIEDYNDKIKKIRGVIDTMISKSDMIVFMKKPDKNQILNKIKEILKDFGVKLQ